MKDKFKQLPEEKEAPAEIKKEVFKSLNSFKLFADILDLFTIKFVSTEGKFLDSMKTKSDKHSSDNENPTTPSK